MTESSNNLIRFEKLVGDYGKRGIQMTTANACVEKSGVDWLEGVNLENKPIEEGELEHILKFKNHDLDLGTVLKNIPKHALETKSFEESMMV